MKYQVFDRTKCRVCGSDPLTRFLELPGMPLTDDLLRANERGSEFLYPIRVYFCATCSLVQTLHDVDVRDYYHDYQYSVALSQLAQDFMRRLAEQTWMKYGFKPGDTVVEVGSGDGVQLSYFQALGARVFGFEPSAPLVQTARQRGIPVSLRLFGEGSEKDIPVDLLPVQVVLLTYTFDHLPEPSSFLNSVRRILDPQRGILVIEVHDLEKIVQRREYCLFEHEHTTYYTNAMIQQVLQQAGFELIDLDLVPQAKRRANSLIAVARPIGSNVASALPVIARKPWENADAFVNFGSEVEASVNRFREFVANNRKQGRRLGGYGAGGRGVMTLAASQVAPEDLAYLCDSNPQLYGYYTPKTHLPVVAPEHVLDDWVDELIVFSFGYLDEIKTTMSAYTQRGGKLVSLLELL